MLLFVSICVEEIHELLLSFAEAGATVVRLKGGDPLVFGRGGEEMDFLQKQGIQVQVIPGTIMSQY
ncbi:putative tetrapyrrole methylase [Rosa chinensis]|uniref:uroporphyrinogen-III C-methyltransferase n=1 Tax=Rosa chinensis TaxID=74649 RepID=A0A2P6SMF4_ROSCH|nr:putative tetrapyrrole methylase [Rosa chinensis]